MGSKENKEILGTNILNLKIENYRAVFGKYSQSFPCIYLLSLGKVKELRGTFGIKPEIDDELMVYKYGFTKDINRRLKEHNTDYGKMKNVIIDLELFNYIDPKYTSEAEADIRDIFETYDNSLNISGRNELVVLNKKQLDRIKKEYTRTGREFAGVSQILQEEIIKLKTELIEMKLKHELEIQQEKMKTHEEKMKTQEEKMKTQEEKIEKEKYKNRAENAEYISSLKETHYAEIQLLLKRKENI